MCQCPLAAELKQSLAMYYVGAFHEQNLRKLQDIERLSNVKSIEGCRTKKEYGFSCAKDAPK